MRDVDRSALRRFGLVVGGMFLAIGCFSAWRGHVVAPRVCWTLGAPLVLLGLVAPAALAPVERVWMRFAEVLGYINTRLILTVLYFLVVTPFGIVRRLRHDPLDRRVRDGRPSGWVPRVRAPVDPARYRQQF